MLIEKFMVRIFCLPIIEFECAAATITKVIHSHLTIPLA